MSTGRRTTTARALQAIERRGILLVYPIANAPDPPSLWSELHPGSKMRWAWDAGADDRVVELWHLREALARSKRVVYGKWFRRRATFFSIPVFRGMLAAYAAQGPLGAGLSPEARAILDLLEEDSPQGTKSLRTGAGLAGKLLEGAWNRAADELWSRLLIVGVREVEEGGFPSLAVGPTRAIFEDAWRDAHDPGSATREADAAALTSALDRSPKLRRHFDATLARLR